MARDLHISGVEAKNLRPNPGDPPYKNITGQALGVAQTFKKEVEMSTLTSTFATAFPGQVANLITAARVALLFLATAFAVSGDAMLAWVAVPLAFVALVMDWLDGYLARRLGCESKVGGLLDIVGDRIAENVWWVVFAWLQIIPLWVPIVVLSRGFVTDGIRSCALTKGFTAFGEATMMKSRLGFALVASRISRATYGTSKVVAFVLLFSLNAAQMSGLTPAFLSWLELVAVAATYLTVALCVIRAIPVVTAAKQVV